RRPIPLAVDLLVGDRPLHDEDERLQFAAGRRAERGQEVLAAERRREHLVVQVHLGQARYDAVDDVFDARLGRRRDRHGVAVAAHALGDPQNVDLVDGGGPAAGPVRALLDRVLLFHRPPPSSAGWKVIDSATTLSCRDASTSRPPQWRQASRSTASCAAVRPPQLRHRTPSGSLITSTRASSATVPAAAIRKPMSITAGSTGWPPTRTRTLPTLRPPARRTVASTIASHSPSSCIDHSIPVSRAVCAEAAGPATWARARSATRGTARSTASATAGDRPIDS